jgi:1-acyl-sn-glycerol-3-phosphate acyltransferase
MESPRITSLPAEKYHTSPNFRRAVGSILKPLEHSVFGITVNYRGLENLTEINSPAILAPNHISLKDPLFDCVFMYRHVKNREVYVAAKDSLWKHRLVGTAIEGIGAWPVDRSGTVEGQANFLRIGQHILARNAHLLIYPQGTRRSIDTIKTKSGATALSLQSGAPIIPIGRYGTETAYSPRKRLPVSVVIGEPLYPPSDSPFADIEASPREQILALREHHQIFNEAFAAVSQQAFQNYGEMTQ